MLTEKKKEFIEFMLSAQVLRFGHFVTKSGRNTQYFVNTGNYKTGAQLSRLGSYYAQLVKDTVGGEFEAMFGPAYKGIPLASACSIALYNDHGIDKPYFFNRKEVKDHGEGGGTVGYAPQDGDRIIIIEDVITAGTAVRETMPILKACADVQVPHMFISVDRCEVGHTPGKTAIMEVEEEFGVKVHPIVTVVDIHEYLKEHGTDPELLKAMEGYMEQYCVLYHPGKQNVSHRVLASCGKLFYVRFGGSLRLAPPPFALAQLPQGALGVGNDVVHQVGEGQHQGDGEQQNGHQGDEHGQGQGGQGEELAEEQHRRHKGRQQHPEQSAP